MKKSKASIRIQSDMNHIGDLTFRLASALREAGWEVEGDGTVNPNYRDRDGQGRVYLTVSPPDEEEK
jgi:hypothetical protein